ncbi:MAG: hypothetical protein ACR2PK_06070 [Acidimicrobiales bacterium]
MNAARFARTGPLSIVLAATLIAAACGGDDDPDLAEAEPTATEVEVEPTTEPTPVPEPTVEPDEGEEAEDEGTGAEEGEDSGDTAGGGGASPTPTQGPISGDPAFTAASKLTTLGLDELFFGDPVEFAAETVGTTWVGLPPEGSRPQCYTVQPSGGPAGIYFTVVDGFVERVDISNPIITTRSGAGVGSSEADLVELFGSSLETAEIEGGMEITFVPTDENDRQYRIIWVTDGVAVTDMRAGRVEFVTPALSCG